MDSWPSPQNALNSEKPGAYELAVRIRNVEVSPDDTIELELYITGYGFINGAKVVFYPPPYFIDTKWSTWTYDLGHMSTNEIGFGAKQDSFKSEAGAVLRISPAGLKAPQWPAPSLFFDTTYDPKNHASISQIATETKAPKAPIEFRLQTHKKIPSGTHELRFHLTYFNGQEWKIDSKPVTVTVPNWFKRHERLTWTIGVLTFIATVAGVIVALAGSLAALFN